jgi:hypothetical protein
MPDISAILNTRRLLDRRKRLKELQKSLVFHQGIVTLQENRCDQKMDTKIIGVILLVCAGLLIQFGYDDVIAPLFSPSDRLKVTIQKDMASSLESIKDSDHPKIHHVEIKYRSKKAHDFLKEHQPKFETHKDGNVWIEVEVLDLPDKENPGLITQTSVFDLKSNNKISEFGQTYYFKDYDKNKKRK